MLSSVLRHLRKYNHLGDEVYLTALRRNIEEQLRLAKLKTWTPLVSVKAESWFDSNAVSNYLASLDGNCSFCEDHVKSAVQAIRVARESSKGKISFSVDQVLDDVDSSTLYRTPGHPSTISCRSTILYLPSGDRSTRALFRDRRMFYRRFVEPPGSFCIHDSCEMRFSPGELPGDSRDERMRRVDETSSDDNVIVERLISYGRDPFGATILELRSAPSNAAVAYLLNAHDHWRRRQQFALDLRLVPIKVVIPLAELHEGDRRVASYINDELKKRRVPCESMETLGLTNIIENNGLGVPFFLDLKGVGQKGNGIVRIMHRETKTGEEVHLSDVAEILQRRCKDSEQNEDVNFEGNDFIS